MSKKFKTQHEHDAYVAEKKKNKTKGQINQTEIY